MRPFISRREFLKDTAAAATSVAMLSLLGTTETSHAAPAAAEPPGPPKLLLEALGSDDLIIGADAARLLGDLGAPAAVGPLADYVTQCPYYAKTAGLDALGRIGDRGVAGRVAAVFDNPNVDDDGHWWYGRHSVQVAAALALLTLGDDREADYLMDPTINMKEWTLFAWFAPSVLRLNDELEASRRLKKRITVAKLTAESREAHRFVIRADALAILGTEEALSALVGLLDHPSRYVRGRAALCLLRVSDRTDHIDRVTSLAANDKTEFARMKASEALAVEGRRFYRDRIAKTLQTGAYDPFDRAAAIESLGALGGEEHLELIAAHLETRENPYVRLCAAEALDRIGTPAAVKAAATCRDDGEMRVRMQVAKCLAAPR